MFIFLFECNLKSNGDHFHLQTSKSFQKKFGQAGPRHRISLCCKCVHGGVSGNHRHTAHIIDEGRISSASPKKQKESNFFLHTYQELLFKGFLTCNKKLLYVRIIVIILSQKDT